ncbi:hypothetical protein BAXH7_03966 [Bacillus amyloliquefaciens XH7]|nr:hypothetical protein LL3_03972 [Bacillus amyloliquefaciens LL3]AEK91074.1 hypothetical protein BAXH7_03966 [Bacillus amyloliquefaciens XH7]
MFGCSGSGMRAGMVVRYTVLFSDSPHKIAGVPLKTRVRADCVK